MTNLSSHYFSMCEERYGRVIHETSCAAMQDKQFSDLYKKHLTTEMTPLTNQN